MPSPPTAHPVFFPINKTSTVEIRRGKSFTQVYGVFRTGLFTQPAENTAKHVDLILCSIFFFPVKMFFSGLPFRSFHGDGFCRTGNCTQSACGAIFTAILITIPPGSYTALVRGNRGDSGIPSLATGAALVEVYDISLTLGVGLDNISTRGVVQRADLPMIVGFVIANGSEDTVVLRGLGPSLAAFGLAGLSDPRLDLFDGEGNLLASNDNWQDTQAAEIEAVGLAPSEPSEATILITLPRGVYTAVLSPVNGVGHGVALAELYRP